MGQACSLCDSERQAEINLDELKTSPLSEDAAAATELLEGKKAREKKEKKKEKKAKKAKKEKRAGEQAEEQSPLPEFTGAGSRVPKVPLLRLTLPLGSDAAVEDAAADHEVTPAAPAAEACGRSSERPWRHLPSVGTWMKPLPKALAARPAAAAEVDLGLDCATKAAQADQEPLPSVVEHPVPKASSVDSFVALAAAAAAPEAACCPLKQPEACPLKQPDLMELFESLASVKAPELPRALDEAPDHPAAAQDAFLAEALLWPAADKEAATAEGVAAAPAKQPAPQEHLVAATAAPAWCFKPSVGTWLHVKAHPLPAAVERGPSQEPAHTPPGALWAHASEADRATVTSPAAGTHGPAAGAGVTYGLEPASSWPQEAPLATSVGDPSAAARTTTTLADGLQSTTAALLARRIISM